MKMTVRLVGFAYLEGNYASNSAPLWEDEEGRKLLSFNMWKSNDALMVGLLSSPFLHLVECGPYEASAFFDEEEYSYVVRHSDELWKLIHEARDKDSVALGIEAQRKEAAMEERRERQKIIKAKNRIEREERALPARTKFKRAFSMARKRWHTIMQESAASMEAYENALSYTQKSYKFVAEAVIFQWPDHLRVRQEYPDTLKCGLLLANEYFKDEQREKSFTAALKLIHFMYFRKGGMPFYNKHFLNK